jgi:F420-dependent oxidoreductase-like protein
MTLRLGTWAQPVDQPGLDYVVEAERLGLDSIWIPEFWGFDALTQIAAAAVVTERIRLCTGIVQIGTRTPAMLAMSAMTLQHLSNGRFVLGLGTSGPQVIEGWHGVPFAQPVTRTRETIEIIRKVTQGERLEYKGLVFELPLPGGEGKALRSALPPVEVPIYLASLGPANLRLTGVAADGWIGNSFFTETADVFFDKIRDGAESVGRTLDEVELTVSVGVEFTDDVHEASQRHAQGFAFTFGAMGSASSNFYNDAFARQGWGDDVDEVQRLWFAGDRDAAAKRVPAEIGRRTNLIGPPNEIRSRLREYRDCGVTTLRIGPSGDTLDERVANLGQIAELVADVNNESQTGAPLI